MQQDQVSAQKKPQASGIAALAPFIALSFLACICLSIAAVIVLALIPVYLRTRTGTNACPPTCSSGCTQQCLLATANCNSISKQITIVTETDFAPYISQSGSNPPVGFDVDLLNAIANIYGFNFVYTYSTFANFIPAVQSDINTISISGEADTLAREQSVDFAQYCKSGNGFLVRSNYNQVINGLTDLCGKRVVALESSTQQSDAINQNSSCGTNPLTLLLVSTIEDIGNSVENNNADVGLIDEVIIKSLVSQSNNQLKLVGQPYSILPRGILCNKQNKPLCCSLVNAINYLIRQGTYEQLLNKYSLTFADNGVCPSVLDLSGSTCLSICAPTNTFCQNQLT